jgi:hypothetical protein
MTTRTRALQGGLVDTKDRLVAAGVALFLLSLLTGFLLAAGPAFIVNPRGVLAGHIEGAMNGMFVILVGLFAPRVRLSDGAARLCMAALLYSAYANWFFTTLGGVLGTSEAMARARARHDRRPRVGWRGHARGCVAAPGGTPTQGRSSARRVGLASTVCT